MKLRNFVSPLITASFMVLAVTGLCMLFGYRGGMVDPIHEIFSLVFLLAGVLHIVVNRKAIQLHLKRPLGAGLAVVFLLVTLAAVVPHGDDSGGNPVRKSISLMLDSDLATIAALSKSSEQALNDKLKKHGVSRTRPDSSLRQIAEASHKNPMELLSILLTE